MGMFGPSTPQEHEEWNLAKVADEIKRSNELLEELVALKKQEMENESQPPQNQLPYR